MEAKYLQRRIGAHVEILSENTGSLSFSKPNMFYWESDSGFEPIIISDGLFLWTYDMDLEQATKKPLLSAIKGSVIEFLLIDNSSLQDKYKVYSQKNSNKLDDCYTLIPKGDENSSTKEISICFSDNQLVSLSLINQEDISLELFFTSININKAIDKNKYIFNPPQGTDVLEMGID